MCPEGAEAQLCPFSQHDFTFRNLIQEENICKVETQMSKGPCRFDSPNKTTLMYEIGGKSNCIW